MSFEFSLIAVYILIKRGLTQLRTCLAGLILELKNRVFGKEIVKLICCVQKIKRLLPYFSHAWPNIASLSSLGTFSYGNCYTIKNTKDALKTLSKPPSSKIRKTLFRKNLNFRNAEFHELSIVRNKYNPWTMIKILEQDNVFVESQRSLIIYNPIDKKISLYLDLNQGPSIPETDDIPMCHCTSLPWY